MRGAELTHPGPWPFAEPMLGSNALHCQFLGVRFAEFQIKSAASKLLET
jgi:hypothetical protein